MAGTEKFPAVKFKKIYCERRELPDAVSGVVTVFRDGEVTLRSNRRETGFTNALKEIGYKKICKGDLAVHVMDAFAGSIGVSDSDGRCSPVVTVCKPLVEADNRYYSYMLRNLAKTGYISSLAKGIRERSTDFRWKDLAQIAVPYPPLAIQRSVANFLDRETKKIDDLIENLDKLIALLEEKRQALIHQAVTKGLNPDVKMKDSGVEWIGLIPEGWQVSKISSVLYFDVGGTPSTTVSKYFDGGIPWISISDMTSRSVTSSGRTLSDEGVVAANLEPVRKGSLLFSFKLSAGKVAFAGIDLYTNEAVAAFRPRETFSLNYAFYAVPGIVNEARRNIYGAPILNKSSISMSLIPNPPIENQIAIANFLDRETKRIDDLIDNLEKLKSLSIEKRSALISEAVTGKLEISPEPEEAAA